MRTRSKLLGAVMVGVVAAGTYGGSVLATPSVGLTTTPIATKIAFDDFDVKTHTIPASLWQISLRSHGLTDGYVVDNKLAPVDPTTGAVASTGWHEHPGPSLVMVIAGAVTDYEADDPTCTGHTYTAGQGFVDSGHGPHILRNEGTVPAETIAVQLVPKDAPRRIDVPQAPGNCPF
jgi:hypothetical protein